MVVNTGEIHIPVSRLNRREINYLHNVIRNAKCDQIDVYYTNGALYIGADSLDTHLIALYKITLEDTNQNKVQVSTVEETEGDTLDIFDEDLLELAEVDEIFGGTQETPAQKVKGFDLSANTQSENKKEIQPDTFSDLPPSYTPPMPPNLKPPTPVEPSVPEVTQVTASSSVDSTGDTIYFCTLTEFLRAFLIEDKATKEIIINVEDRKVRVNGGDYLFTYPVVNGYVAMSYYLEAMRDKTWEKVNVEAVQKVAKAISSTNQDVVASMFVTLEKDRIFSDNSFLLVSAKSWKLQNRYHFTYETVPALVKLPVGAEGNAYVSKSPGMIYLRFNEMYLAWTNEDNGQSENILEMIDMDAMIPVLTLKKEDIKKLRVFDKMITAMQVDVDRVVNFEMIGNGLAKVTQNDNVLLCRVNCLKDTVIEVDLQSLLTAVNLCNSASPVIKADVNNKESDFLVISGELDVLINVEKVKKV